MRRRRRAHTGDQGPQTSHVQRGTTEAPLPQESREPPESPEAHFDEGVGLLQAAIQQVRGTGAGLESPPPASARRRGGDGNGHGRAATTPADADEIPADDELDADARRRQRAEQRRRAEERRRRARARGGVTHRSPAVTAAPEAPPAPPTPVPELREEPGAAPAEPADTKAFWGRKRAKAPEPDVEEVVEADELDAEPGAAAETPSEAVVIEADELDADPDAPEAATAVDPQAPPAPVVAPGWQAAQRPKPTRTAWRRGRERVLVAGLVVVVLAAVAILGAVTLADRGGGGSGTAASSAGRAELTFDPISLAPGATVEREWTLSGADGTRFESTLTFENSTDEPISASHTEVIPKSLAASVDDIRFDPEPVVVNPDPVVRYAVTIPADESVTATYRIDVDPDGVDDSRLEAWADDMENAERIPSTSTTSTTTTSTTTTTPPTTTTTKPSSSGGGSGSGGSGGGSPTGGAAPAPSPGPAPAPAPAPEPGPPPPPPPPGPTGTIVIAKRTVGGSGTFTFNGPGGPVQVTASGSNGYGQSAAITVSPGQYAWTEVGLPPSWRLFNIDCTDRDAGPFEWRSTVSGATATFNVQQGETVVCTWTNRKS